MLAHDSAAGSHFSVFHVASASSGTASKRDAPSKPPKVPDFVGTLLLRGTLGQVLAGFDQAYDFLREKADEEGYPPANVAAVAKQLEQLGQRRQELVDFAVREGSLTLVTAAIDDTMGWYRPKLTVKDYPQERVRTFCKPLDELRARRALLQSQEKASRGTPEEPVKLAARGRRSSSRKTTAQNAVSAQA